MFNCTGTIGDDMKVHTLIENIFRGNQDKKYFAKQTIEKSRRLLSQISIKNKKIANDKKDKEKKKDKKNQMIKEKPMKNLDDFKNSIGSRSLEMEPSERDLLGVNTKHDSLSPVKEKKKYYVGTAGLIAETNLQRKE